MSAFLASSRPEMRRRLFSAAFSAVAASCGPFFFGAERRVERSGARCWPSANATRPKEKLLLSAIAGDIIAEAGDSRTEERASSRRASSSARAAARSSFLWARRASSFFRRASMSSWRFRAPVGPSALRAARRVSMRAARRCLRISGSIVGSLM